MQEPKFLTLPFPRVSVTATIDYALVLDSKGIREAVAEKNPLKAVNSFAIRDIIDEVDKPLIVCEATVRYE